MPQLNIFNLPELLELILPDSFITEFNNYLSFILGLLHHVNETNCLELPTPDGTFSVLGKVELQTSFSRASSTNFDGKHKSTDPVEFLVVGLGLI
ncbi:2185_t:CDS:2 [Entrophospora sp. SA101]|nr:2185_t:CDS:2 [Entrophospora sp. SA101]